MSTRTKERFREKRSRELVRTGLRGAGTLRAVGAAMPVPRVESTVGSWVTRTDCPELVPLYRVMIGLDPWNWPAVRRGLEAFRALNLGEETSARALAMAQLRAVDTRELLEVDAETLLKRVAYLRGHRHLLNARETEAFESRSPDALECVAAETDAQMEFEAGCRILEEVWGIPATTAVPR